MRYNLDTNKTLQVLFFRAVLSYATGHHKPIKLSSIANDNWYTIHSVKEWTGTEG